MKKPALHFQRFEFKYFLPFNKVDKLIPALLQHMEYDPYIKDSEKDYYIVNSIYFDSPNYGCYWDKESGIISRKKMRIRFYNHISDFEQKVFLEMKRRKNVQIVKDRITIAMSDCANDKIDENLRQIIKKDSENNFVRELFWFKTLNRMRPKIFISYKRRALVGKKNEKFRVTFDFDIQARLCSSIKRMMNDKKKIYPNGVVLELKYNNVLPKWFHEIIKDYQLNVLSYSKYCNSIRITIPKFDDNNYLV